MNNPMLIKHLAAKGFTGKQIRLITQSNQSYISKVLTGRIAREATDWPVTFTDKEMARYDALIKIIALPNLNTNQVTQWEYYYFLLRALMVKKDVIIKKFPEIKNSQEIFDKEKDKINFKNFHSSFIGIPQETYDDLVSIL
jgi:hypothetical protein